MRFVLFALFDGALLQVEIVQRGEALDGLLGKVSIGHGMANDNRLATKFAELGGDQARDGTLPASGADGAHGDDGHGRFDLSVLGSEQPEIGAGGNHARGKVHQVRIGDIAVGEHHSIDIFFGDDLLQIFFLKDGNAFWIEASGEFGWVVTARNIGDLSSGEGHHVIVKILAEYNIKVVKVAACGSKDKNSFHSIPQYAITAHHALWGSGGQCGLSRGLVRNEAGWL